MDAAAGIQIRTMDEQSFSASKKLWSVCFPEDGPQFIDWYYGARTRPEYALGAFIGSAAQPVGMLHILPRDMRFNGSVRRIGFITGVATHPDLRRRGICRRLFVRAFELMRMAGLEASVLQPFDTGFYEQFGYKTFAYLNRITVSGDRLSKAVRSADSIVPVPERLAEQYSAYTLGYEGNTLRDAAYFTGFIKEFSLPGARLKASLYGCCAGYEEGEGFTAYELFASTRDISRLLALLPRGYDTVTFFLPDNTDTGPLRSALEGELTLETIPFSMLAPVSKGFFAGEEPKFTLDKY